MIGQKQSRYIQIHSMLFAFLCAFLILSLCSRSSFLYPFNIWDDVNSYFTMGKSMMRGMVPYRDLFDQKGILLYFLYGIGYLMSHTTFGGVFIMEVIAGSISVRMILYILKLYVSDTIAYVLAPITFALMCSSRSFYWGGSAEEFLLPALLVGLFLMLRYFRERFPAPVAYRDVFLGGLMAGIVFHIKFNSLGFYLGWAFMVMLADLNYELAVSENKSVPIARIRKILFDAVVFLSGMLAITLPFAVYFGIHGAVDDWVRVYLYDNLFIYSESLPFGTRVYQMCRVILSHVFSNWQFSYLILFGMAVGLILVLCKRSKSAMLQYVSAVIMAACLLTIIFIGGRDLPYYPYPVSAFTVVGTTAVGVLLQSVIDKRKEMKSSKYMSCALAGVGMLVSVGIVFLTSLNIQDIGMAKEDLWLFRMRDIIAVSGIEEPKLINLNCFDAGLYTVTDTVPGCYYFQTQTIPIKGIWETQKDYVKAGEPDFVLIRDSAMDFAYEGYEIIAEEKQEISGNLYWFILYQKMTGEYRNVVQ